MKKFNFTDKLMFLCLLIILMPCRVYAAVPNYLALISNTLVCRMTESGCALYFNGNQQFPFQVITSQGNNGFDFSRFDISNVQFYIKQNGAKFYFPLDQEVYGIKITQIKNQYVYGFPRLPKMSAGYAQSFSDANNAFYISVSRETYLSFGLSFIIHAEYREEALTVSTESSIGNSIALNLVEPQNYVSNDIVISGENVLSSNSCPPNTTKTKVADYCIRNTLDGWQEKITGGKDGLGPQLISGPPGSQGAYSLSQPLAGINFKLSGSSGHNFGTLAITQRQPQEMVHYQNYNGAPYFVDLKTFNIELDPSLNGQDFFPISSAQKFNIYFRGLSYADGYSIVKNLENGFVSNDSSTSININCYSARNNLSSSISNPFENKSGSGECTPGATVSLFNRYHNKAADYCKNWTDTSGWYNWVFRYGCYCEKNWANIDNPDFARILRGQNGFPVVRECRDWGGDPLKDMTNEYRSALNDMNQSCAKSSFSNAPFWFNFKSPVCSQLLSDQLRTGIDYSGINPVQLVFKPAQTTLLINVTDDFGNISQIVYPISFVLAANGFYYLTFN